jgi:hypothetical protein
MGADALRSQRLIGCAHHAAIDALQVGWKVLSNRAGDIEVHTGRDAERIENACRGRSLADDLSPHQRGVIIRARRLERDVRRAAIEVCPIEVGVGVYVQVEIAGRQGKWRSCDAAFPIVDAGDSGEGARVRPGPAGGQQREVGAVEVRVCGIGRGVDLADLDAVSGVRAQIGERVLRVQCQKRGVQRESRQRRPAVRRGGQVRRHGPVGHEEFLLLRAGLRREHRADSHRADRDDREQQRPQNRRAAASNSTRRPIETTATTHPTTSVHSVPTQKFGLTGGDKRFTQTCIESNLDQKSTL